MFHRYCGDVSVYAGYVDLEVIYEDVDNQCTQAAHSMHRMVAMN